LALRALLLIDIVDGAQYTRWGVERQRSVDPNGALFWNYCCRSRIETPAAVCVKQHEGGSSSDGHWTTRALQVYQPQLLLKALSHDDDLTGAIEQHLLSMIGDVHHSEE